jgi:hypothetical protein
MGKEAISVTLDADNITWLKGRATARGARSVSELLDQIVTAARTSGGSIGARSVVGTIDIDAGDPTLASADGAIRALFSASVRRPLAVKDERASYGVRRPKKGRG